MKDAALLMRARERMNLRKALWFRCMDKVIETQLGTANYTAYGQALRIISRVYAMSCQEVIEMESA